MADIDEEQLDAKEWVKRSRHRAALAEAQKKRAKKRVRQEENDDERARSNDEEDYTEKDLVGLRVSHGANDFEIGESAILTLRDTEILETDENGVVRGLAEDEDELENIDRIETNRRKEAELRAKRAREGAYRAFDDEEFETLPGQDSQKRILSQYDEELNRGKKKSSDGIIIGSNLMLNKETELDLEASQRKTESLKTQSRIISDYFTSEEMATFKKPKKMRRKNPQKQRVIEEDTSSLQDSLLLHNSTVDGNSSANHGSRAARKAASEAKSAQNIENDKKKRFDQALSKASKKSEITLQSNDVPFAMPLQLPKAENVLEDDDLDSDLMASLARARRLAQLKIASQKKHDAAAEVAGRIAKENASKSGQQETDTDKTEEKETGLVFTSATEFTSRMQSVLQERLRDRETSMIKEAERKARDRNVSKSEEPAISSGTWSVDKNYVNTGTSQVTEDVNDDASIAAKDEQIQESDEEDKQLGYMLRQPLIRSSMTATLSILQQSGELKQKTELAGRAKDRRDSFDDDGESEGVKLDYRDEFGRQMTRAEAFRQLNYQFHGYGPGKKKMEKRLKAVQEQKIRERTAADQSTLGVLKKVQEVTSRPFVMLHSGSSSMGGPMALNDTEPDKFELKKGKSLKSNGGKSESRIRPS